MDKGVLIIGGATVVVLGVIMAAAMSSPRPKVEQSFNGSDNDVVSEKGVHWHPELAISIKGQKQEIPTNIGVGTQYSGSKFYNAGMQMTDIHTHSADGTLHWEMETGPVKIGQAKLASYFEVWGKTFTKDQILDSKSGEGATVKMNVNGQPNNEFENYIVKDKDKIEIRYE